MPSYRKDGLKAWMAFSIHQALVEERLVSSSSESSTIGGFTSTISHEGEAAESVVR